MKNERKKQILNDAFFKRKPDAWRTQEINQGRGQQIFPCTVDYPKLGQWSNKFHQNRSINECARMILT